MAGEHNGMWAINYIVIPLPTAHKVGRGETTSQGSTKD